MSLLRYIKKTPSCKSLAKYTRQTDQVQHVLVIDLEHILSWLALPHIDLCPSQEGNTITYRLTRLIQALRYLSIEPVVFLRPPIGSCDSFPLLLSSLKESYLSSLSCDHAQLGRQDNEAVNPLLSRQLLSTLISHDIDIIYTFDVNYYIWDAYYYMCNYQQDNIVGILSTDVNFLLIPGCKFIDLVDFDLSRSLKFENRFNSEPSELNFHYVTLESVLKHLNITRCQLIDTIILSGNIYTTHFNSTYKLSSYLKMDEGKFKKFEDLVEFIRRLKSPIFEIDERLVHVCDSIPLYKRCVSRSYALYKVPNDETPPPNAHSSVAYWAQKRIETNRMSAMLYSLIKTGTCKSCTYLHVHV